MVTEPGYPVAGVVGVRGIGDDAAAAALRDLYGRSYSPLVKVLAAVLQDVDEAEEAVQEAFVRLLPRWEKVSRYDEPEAWLRQVAFRCASNRRRKLRNGLAALRRHGGVADAPGPVGDAVDVQRAMRTLPVAQRHALVLVHVVGLDVEAAARELGVPVGTVKSRLSRGRAALSELLSQEEVAGHG